MDDDWELATAAPTPAKKQLAVGTATTTTPVKHAAAASARRAPSSSQSSDFKFTRVSDYSLDMFMEHAQRCKTDDCVICFAAHRLDGSPSFWSSIQLDPESSERGSWAAFSTDGGTPRFGCWVCHLSQKSQKHGYPAFSASTSGALHNSNLKKHARSAVHKALAAECLAVIASGKLPEGLPVPGAPPASDFRQLFQGIQGGKSVDDVGGRKKQRRLLWCLAEGFRAIQREFFRGDHVSTILQDSTEDRLLMRIKGCNDTLDVRSGIVGVADLTMAPFNARATGIKDAALSLLKQFATPLRSPPYSRKTGKLDKKSWALRASPSNRPPETTMQMRVAGRRPPPSISIIVESGRWRWRTGWMERTTRRGWASRRWITVRRRRRGGQDEDAQVGENQDMTHQHVLNKGPDDDGDDKKHQ